jgi:uncharacterized membrane protein
MWQLLAITSALFSALAAVFEKKALFKTDPLSFSFILSAITFVLALPFFAFVEFGQINTSAVIVLYIKSVLGAAAFLLVMYGIKNNELSSSLPLLVFTPALVAIVAFFFLGEAIETNGIFGMILLLIGTYFLQLEKNGSWLSPFLFVQKNKAQWYIIGAIVLFTITSVLDKTILKAYKLDPDAFLPIQQLFFTLNFLLIFLIKKQSFKTVGLNLKQTFWIILMVAVFAIIYRYSHILAIKSGSVALVLSVKRTSVFFAAIIGGTWFKEKNVLQRSIATAVMVAGVILIILA